VIQTSLQITMALLGLAMMLNLWRLLRGPGTVDRVLALDTLYINTIGLLFVFSMHLGSAIYFEAEVIIALLGFVGTLMLCKYLLRRDIIE
jgi:multicomponent K+:H+ antiporter subunit F